MRWLDASSIFGWPAALQGAGRSFQTESAARGSERARVASDPNTHDDASMAAIAAGDARVFRELSERHLGGIVRYATRMLGTQAEGEDVAQETFLRLWRDAGRYEARGYKLSTWLYRVAHNLCVDRLRQRKPMRAMPLEIESRDRTSTPLAEKETAALVSAALAELPERQRAAIVLVHYEEKSHEEVALVLGCGVEAVESLLSRGRRTLRERLASLHAAQGEP